MGPGGERLHEWMGSEEGQRLLGQTVGGLGAVIAGRRTYDDSVRWWGADGPSGPARRPVIVVTHEAPSEAPENGVYQFVTGGIADALDRARTAASGDIVCVMGGADVIRQYLNAGLSTSSPCTWLPCCSVPGPGCSRAPPSISCPSSGSVPSTRRRLCTCTIA
jgi:dihydrofolate reductase